MEIEITSLVDSEKRDRNTRFFHQSTIIKRTLKDCNGSMVDDDEAIR